MNAILTTLKEISFSISGVLNIILAIFAFCQWKDKRAKERSIENSLISVRRTLDRFSNDVFREKKQVIAGVIDSLDAILATLGRRLPFIKYRDKIIEWILGKNEIEISRDLEEISKKTKNSKRKK